MDANQMVLECKLKSDSLDSSTMPDISNENWLYYLNLGQDWFYKTHYSRNNILGQGYQEIQKRTDDLNNITKTYYFAATSAGSDRYFIDFKLPFTNEGLTIPSTDVYAFYLMGTAQIVSSSCGNKFVGIKIESLDTLQKVLVDPFKKSNFNRVVGHFENGGMYLHTGGLYSIGKAAISCIKVPVTISNDVAYAPLNDCELAEHTHREIIAKAVELAVGDLKPEKFQIKAQQNTQIE